MYEKKNRFLYIESIETSVSKLRVDQSRALSLYIASSAAGKTFPGPRIIVFVLYPHSRVHILLIVCSCFKFTCETRGWLEALLSVQFSLYIYIYICVYAIIKWDTSIILNTDYYCANSCDGVALINSNGKRQRTKCNYQWILSYILIYYIYIANNIIINRQQLLSQQFWQLF